MLRIYSVEFSSVADGHERSAGRARTDAERASYLLGAEMYRRDSYCLPVTVLERALRDSRYQGREEQEAMRRALEKYLWRRNEARRLGLYKPEPPTAGTKAPR